jgi:putative ABC transport system permease protein
VIIGVTAVVVMLAIGLGARQQILSRMGHDGITVVSIWAEWTQRSRPLTLSDAQALTNLPGVAAVAPIRWWGETFVAGEYRYDGSVSATTETWFLMGRGTFTAGRPFSAMECELGLPVVVLGPTVAGTLFPDSNPIGGKVRIGAGSFTVVGVLKSSGDSVDQNVLVPINTARRMLRSFSNLRVIQVLGTKVEVLDQLQERIGSTLLKRHRKRSDKERDFSIWVNREILEKYEEFTNIFAALLAGVGSISLLVGGIGIMNVMLMTVTERTREIGLRKAIGARECDIRNQFLIEAVLTTVAGGVLGVAVGALIVWVAGSLLPFPVSVNGFSVLLAMGFSASVGLFFGYIPARRAARLDPIEALRYE